MTIVYKSKNLTPEPQPESAGNWSDREIALRNDDRFQFNDYAKVLAQRIVSVDTPLTIGIVGRWGSGKTSLMRLTRAALPKPGWGASRLHSLWINVWQLSTQDEVWQAFLQAIFAEVHAALPWWRRVNWGKLVRQLLANSYRIVLVAAPIILGGLLSKPDANWYDFYSLTGRGLVAGGSTLLAVLALLFTVVRPALGAAREVVKIDLKEILKDAPYEAQISALAALQGRFEQMVELLVGREGRLVVFIDDLDRCPPDKATEVLEAIKLFTTTLGCVYVLGLDLEIVRRGVQAKHGLNSEDEATEYIEKIIQVPFHLPPLDEQWIERFVRNDYAQLAARCPTAAEVFAKGLEPNPRKVKRALNIYRTVLELADVRFRSWEMDLVDPELVAKMIVLQSRFRRLYDYLAAHLQFLLTMESVAGDWDEIKLHDYLAGLASELGSPALDETLDVLLPKDKRPGLIEPTQLRPLSRLLASGGKRFDQADQRDLLRTYIYLVTVTEGGSTHVRPSTRERKALLGGEVAAIRSQVEEILARGTDVAGKQLIGERYLQRLENVIGSDYTSIEQRSAIIAIGFLELELSGTTPESLQNRLNTWPPLAATAGLAPAAEPRRTLARRLRGILQWPTEFPPEEVHPISQALDFLEQRERAVVEPETLRIEARSELELQVGRIIMGDMIIAPTTPLAGSNDYFQSSSRYGFRLGRYPVTNAEYTQFLAATTHLPPRHWRGRTCPAGLEHYPVVGVAWHEAIQYCQWLSEVIRKPCRLPTEGEWEWAAHRDTDLAFPWGNPWWSGNLYITAEGIYHPGPVGAHSPQGDSMFGLADMAGNVWEWTSSRWGSRWEQAEYTQRRISETSEAEIDYRVLRVIRGGGFHANQTTARCDYRTNWLASILRPGQLPLERLDNLTTQGESWLTRQGLDHIQALALASRERLNSGGGPEKAIRVDWLDQALLLSMTDDSQSGQLARAGIRTATDLLKDERAGGFPALSKETGLDEAYLNYLAACLWVQPNLTLLREPESDVTALSLMPELSNLHPNPGLPSIGFRVVILDEAATTGI